NRREVASNRREDPPLPTNVFGSPDGKIVLAERVDERETEPYPYLEFVPADGSVRPKVHFIRHTLVGEKPRKQTFHFIDVATGARTALDALPSGLAVCPDLAEVFWSDDGRSLYMTAHTLDA